MSDGIVICSLERLFDWEEPGKIVLGVTLSVAWNSSIAKQPANFLAPWEWLPWQRGPEDLKFQFGVIRDNDLSSIQLKAEYLVSPESLAWNGNPISQLRLGPNYRPFAIVLNQKLSDMAQADSKRLGFKYQSENLSIDSETNQSYAAGASWPSVLGDLSTRPAPIPQTLLLSFVLKPKQMISELVNQGGSGWRLFVAPQLPKGVLGTALDIPLLSDTSAGAAQQPLTISSFAGDMVSVVWHYSDPRFDAQTEMVSLSGPPAVSTFFDMQTRLVNSPNNVAWNFDEDWQASLESRIAERLDFSGQLVRIIETLGTQPADSISAGNLAEAAIATLRDIAGIGCDRGPSGQSFLEAENATKSDAELKSVQDAVKSTNEFKTVEAWKRFIISAFSKKESPLYDPNIANLNAPSSILQPRTDVSKANPISPAVASNQLHQLRQKLLSPDILLVFLQAQLDTLKGPGLPADLANVTLVDTKLLPPVLRMENLGRYWSRIQTAIVSAASKADTRATRSVLETALKGSIQSRFDSASPPSLPAIEKDVSDVVLSILRSPPPQVAQDWAKSAAYAIPDPASNNAKPANAPNAAGLAPQGITLQVTELGEQKAPAIDEIASVRKLQGVGILLAYDTAPLPNGAVGRNWRCLNYCDAYYMTGTESHLLERAVLAPTRFTFQNNLALATVTYNNESLPAPGPMSEVGALLFRTKTTVGNDLLVYRYPDAKQAGGKDVRLTSLGYGQDYRPQPFLVSNAGVLPKLLTDGTSWLELKKSLDGTRPLGAKWKRVSYRRQTAVGSLRLSDPYDVGKIDAQRSLNFPTIPDGVFPRTLAAETLPTDTLPKDQPLLVLAPHDARFRSNVPNSFEFALRPPAVDMLTWDRSVNTRANALAAKRVEVLNDLIQHKNDQARRLKAQGRANILNVNGADIPDLTLDDPATVVNRPGINGAVDYDCRFYFELIPEPGTGAPVSALVRFPQPLATGLPLVQSPPALFQIAVGTGAGGPTVSGVRAAGDGFVVGGADVTLKAGDKLIVEVSEGKLATVKLSVCVPASSIAQFGIAFDKAALDPSGRYYRVSPTEIKIEVATDAIPSEEDLFEALKPESPQFDTFNGTAKIYLQTKNLKNAAYVQSAEILRQVWKWQGRPVDPPVPPLPLARTNNSPTLLEKWMAQEFGTRKDFLRTTMTPPVTGGDQNFTFTEDLSCLFNSSERTTTKLPTTLGTAVVPADQQLRGSYIRYGVQVESRYKGILNGAGYRRGQNRIQSPPKLWRDMYIPSRKLTELKPPSVKLALPLTRNPNGQTDEGQGILVLLRGPWFQVCGLGEGLQARVTVVEAPENAPNTPQANRIYYYQYGPDPILSGATGSYGVSGIQPTGLIGNILGPVGHTFDSVSDDQLFVNTSFILSYPKLDGLSWKPWAFCQLQFRRVVYTRAGDGEPSAFSDWTPPLWIQLLPDFDIYTDSKLNQGRFDSLRFRTDAPASPTLYLTDQNGKRLPNELIGGSGDTMFADYMVLTRYVVDVTGVPIQEAYVGLYRQYNNAWVPVDNALRLTTDVYRARIITVQGRKIGMSWNISACPDEPTFWDALFSVVRQGDSAAPGTQVAFIPDTDRLRIVGLSSPIEMFNSNRNRIC